MMMMFRLWKMKPLKVYKNVGSVGSSVQMYVQLSLSFALKVCPKRLMS
jgi:hypothetical protein